MSSVAAHRCLHHRLLEQAVGQLRSEGACHDLAARALAHPPCDMSAHAFAVLDCESTSGDHQHAELLELAIATVTCDGAPIGVFSSLISGVGSFNADIHRIDDELLSFGRPAAEVAAAVAPLLEGRVLVAFRPELDVALVDRLLSAAGLSVQVPYIVCLAEHAPLLGSAAMSLASLAADCRVDNIWPHRAIGDVMCETALLARLLHSGLLDSASVMLPWKRCGGWTLGAV